MSGRETERATLAQLGEFDEIIDVRAPSEYAEDHVPGAVSFPVLSDEERARVGTLYKQDSPFAAKKVGAALIARNIARHLEESFADRGPKWRPLIYCWRGGKRSGAMTLILRQIGWDARRLEGGYKGYRRHVVDRLAELPRSFAYRVVCGATGSGKSRLLEELERQGAQVLDLEKLAAHKGSVLGALPDQPQPAQKMFESLLLVALEKMDPARPTYVEAESRKIGSVHLPDALIETMRAAPCLSIEATREARLDFLLGDYDYFLAEPARLARPLEALRALHSAETLTRWEAWIAAGNWRDLVGELLDLHYDPLYRKSQSSNFSGYAEPRRFSTDDLAPAGITRLAQAIRAAE